MKSAATSVLVGIITMATLLSLMRSAAHANFCVIGIQFGVSYEVWDGRCHASKIAAISNFVAEHKHELRKASRRFGVDERLIVLEVAFEALTNVHYGSYFGLTRSSGPGKVHYKEAIWSEGNPVSKQVEMLGMLPPRSVGDRARILSTVSGSFMYIAAIDRGFMDSQKAVQLSCDPSSLLSLYVSRDLETYQREARYVESGPFIVPGVASWTRANLSWIEAITEGTRRVC